MKKVVLAFGRLNPPSRAHEFLISTLEEIAEKDNGEARLYLSHSHDPKKNPLDYETKLMYCKKAFGNVVKNSDAKHMYAVMEDLYKEGVTDVTYVCGSDRLEAAQKLVNKDNSYMDKSGNILYSFDSFKVVQAGNERLNEDDIPLEKVSASLMRQLASDNDLEAFKECCPSGLSEDECENMFNDVRAGMGLVEDLQDLMEASTFSSKRNMKDIESFESAYNLLRDEIINAGADDEVINQVDRAIKNIEALTNSIDLDTINKLKTYLIAHGIEIPYSEFVNEFEPTEGDLAILLNGKSRVLKPGTNNVYDFKFTEDFVKNLIKSTKSFKKSVSARIGPYENFIALVYDGMKPSIGFGDVVRDDDEEIEVKAIDTHAVIAKDQSTYDLLNAFNKLTTELEIRPRTARAGTALGNVTIRYSNLGEAGNTPVNVSELPRILRNLVSGTSVTYKTLYEEVFKKAIELYANRFSYIAICKGSHIQLFSKNQDIGEQLLKNFSVTFEVQIGGGRAFSIR